MTNLALESIQDEEPELPKAEPLIQPLAKRDVPKALEDVYGAMLQAALEPSHKGTPAHKLFLERFDPEYQNKMAVPQTAITFILPEGAEAKDPKKSLIAAVMEVEGTLKS